MRLSLRQKAGQLRHLWRLPNTVHSMQEGTAGRLEVLARALQSTHDLFTQRLNGLTGSLQSAQDAITERLLALDRAAQQDRRDLLAELEKIEQLEPLVHAGLGLHRTRLRELHGQVEIVTDHPVALDSPDHQVPWGTARDNSRNQRFNARLIALVPGDRLSVLDLGCSGGGQVRSFIEQGYLAVGVEGSDYSAQRLRAEWATIPDYLFTADITKPFRLRTPREADAQRFGVVTMWEVIEHIAEADLPQVLANIDAHLRPGGIVVMSVSPNSEVIRGKQLHQTIQARPWWDAFLQASGRQNHPNIVTYFAEDFVRGGINAPDSFHYVISRAGETPSLIGQLQHLAWR